MEYLNSTLLGARGVANFVFGLILVALSGVILSNDTNGARDILADFIFGFGLLYLTLSVMSGLRSLGVTEVCGVEIGVLLFIPMVFTVYCVVECVVWVRGVGK